MSGSHYTLCPASSPKLLVRDRKASLAGEVFRLKVALEPGLVPESSLCSGFVLSVPSYLVRQYLTNLGLGLGSFDRQRRKRPAFLEKSGSVSLSVRQTLASRALDGKVRAFPVIEAQLHAVIEAEIVFRKIAVQMLLCTMLINATHTALED